MAKTSRTTTISLTPASVLDCALPPMGSQAPKNAWPVRQVRTPQFEMLMMYCNANHHACRKDWCGGADGMGPFDENLKFRPRPRSNRSLPVHAYRLPGRLRFLITMKGVHTPLGTYVHAP